MLTIKRRLPAQITQGLLPHYLARVHSQALCLYINARIAYIKGISFYFQRKPN